MKAKNVQIFWDNQTDDGWCLRYDTEEHIDQDSCMYMPRERNVAYDDLIEAAHLEAKWCGIELTSSDDIEICR